MLVLAIAASAWAVTVRQAHGMGNGPGTMGMGLAVFLLMWVVMMVAMMLPSVAPVASLWRRTITGRAAGGIAAVRTVVFAAGYFVAWSAVGLVAYASVVGMGRLADRDPHAALWVGSGLVAAAGVYQLTPLKRACLRKCRSPLGLLLHYSGYRGRSRDFRVGVHHGLYCVACCWGLMVVLLATGVMNVAVMAVLAAVIFLEKIWGRGPRLATITGVALITLALLAPSHPWLLPGVHMKTATPNTTPMRMSPD